MSTDQFDPEQVVRIRMRVGKHITDPTVAEWTEILWSDRMPRRIAEVDVTGGPFHLALEHGDGRYVLSAAIIPWKGN